jgi:Cu/Ag efflux protein CusF
MFEFLSLIEFYAEKVFGSSSTVQATPKKNKKAAVKVKATPASSKKNTMKHTPISAKSTPTQKKMHVNQPPSSAARRSNRLAKQINEN